MKGTNVETTQVDASKNDVLFYNCKCSFI